MPVNRQQDLECWLHKVVPEPILAVESLPGDASFRRYTRINTLTSSYMCMDAPPDLEDCQPFVAIAKAFTQLGLQVPAIIAADVPRGFLLLTDFGDRLYALALNTHTADALYQQALADLIKLQQCQAAHDWELPHFNATFMQQELDNFTYWYLEKHLGLQIDSDEQTLIQRTYLHLINKAEEQPQVCVHRDYHSRNLMLLDNGKTGILDFQDAVWGPITYDAVSLLRDCYISWPAAKVEQWRQHFYQQLCINEAIPNIGIEQFSQWFDWMGIQRHLKAIFIFARKYHRDGSTHYLNDIPRALNYITTVSAQYPELKLWRQWLLEKTPAAELVIT